MEQNKTSLFSAGMIKTISRDTGATGTTVTDLVALLLTLIKFHIIKAKYRNCKWKTILSFYHIQTTSRRSSQQTLNVY